MSESAEPNEIPSAPPPPGASDPEVPDQPLGPPGEAAEEEVPLPGLPDSEPPASE